MALETIITAVKNILESVDGVGKVNDYERNTVDEKKFIAAFCSPSNSSLINGWTITRGSTSEIRTSVNAPDLNSGQSKAEHTIVIRGYYSFEDDKQSEKIFRALVESVRAALRSNYTLTDSCDRHDSPQNPVNEPRKMANTYLVHYAEIHINVHESFKY